MMRGEQKFLNALERFDGNIRQFALDVTDSIKANIISEIYREDAIDTGKFIQALDYRSVSGGDDYRYLIDTSKDARVYYDGYVEFPRTVRGTFISGRYVYEDGIQNTDIGDSADRLMESSFRI